MEISHLKGATDTTIRKTERAAVCIKSNNSAWFCVGGMDSNES